MLFNTLQFLLLFLPLTLLVFGVLGRLQLNSAQVAWLVLCSLFFYASWNPVYILLILGSVVANYLFGRALAAANGGASFGILTAGVSFNLLLLGYFKYTGFFLDSLNSAIGLLIPIPEITLPLAISFFTFQQIAYLVDVYRDEAEDYSFIHYCLFVTFFPQLIAGPIVHHKEMMPQFDSPAGQRVTLENLQVGIAIIAIGLFKKAVLADNLALLADPLFTRAEGGQVLSFTESWIATLAFTGQIYFDFSGYTDMAIGAARLFGIRLPENFYSPYKSPNIIEFWRRWHITLSRFLRDYLYISLGGNRKGVAKRYRNLLLTMLLGGLWHGANWNFVIWGGLHGFYLVINHFWHWLCDRAGIDRANTGLPLRVVSQAVTLLAVMLAWVFFRAESTAGAFSILGSMARPDNLAVGVDYIQGVVADEPLMSLMQSIAPNTTGLSMIWALLVLAFCLMLFAPNTQQFMRDFQPTLEVNKWPANSGRLVFRLSIGCGLLLGLLAYLGLLNLGNEAEFIYFQF